jgi:phosphodiester glycosidase
VGSAQPAPITTASQHRNSGVTPSPGASSSLRGSVSTPVRPLRSLPAPAGPESPPHLRSLRLRLADDAWTTLRVASYDPARTEVRVVRFGRPTPLEAWCTAHGTGEAIVGGFFVRAGGVPLGELWTSGIARATLPFAAPWNATRACVHVARERVAIARRPELPVRPRGDLLQAGPLLVRGGAPCTHGDPEGFSAASEQFDSDITAGRHPRAALAIGRRGRLLAVAADGRDDGDAGLTLDELAEALVALGALHAINLDGGGSTSLVCGGRLRNRPREAHGVETEGGRPITTALLFRPR